MRCRLRARRREMPGPRRRRIASQQFYNRFDHADFETFTVGHPNAFSTAPDCRLASLPSSCPGCLVQALPDAAVHCLLAQSATRRPTLAGPSACVLSAGPTTFFFLAWRFYRTEVSCVRQTAARPARPRIRILVQVRLCGRALACASISRSRKWSAASDRRSPAPLRRGKVVGEQGSGGPWVGG